MLSVLVIINNNIIGIKIEIFICFYNLINWSSLRVMIYEDIFYFLV